MCVYAMSNDRHYFHYMSTRLQVRDGGHVEVAAIIIGKSSWRHLYRLPFSLVAWHTTGAIWLVESEHHSNQTTSNLWTTNPVKKSCFLICEIWFVFCAVFDEAKGLGWVGGGGVGQHVYPALTCRGAWGITIKWLWTDQHVTYIIKYAVRD